MLNWLIGLTPISWRFRLLIAIAQAAEWDVAFRSDGEEVTYLILGESEEIAFIVDLVDKDSERRFNNGKKG